MPELPEVDAMVKYLRDVVPWGATVQYTKSTKHYDVSALLGATFLGVSRKAKYILFDTDRGLLVGHNKFTGYWSLHSKPWSFDYLEYSRRPTDRDVRIRLALGAVDELEYHDARTLGTLQLYPVRDPRELPFLRKMGPDVVATPTLDTRFMLNAWTLARFYDKLMLTDREIKLALLDQELQAGIGNIYACESLWRAGINPFRKSSELSEQLVARLYDSVLFVVNVAIQERVQYDNYVMIFRSPNCPKCGDPTTRSVQANRGTYWCTSCQRD